MNPHAKALLIAAIAVFVGVPMGLWGFFFLASLTAPVAIGIILAIGFVAIYLAALPDKKERP